MLVNNSYGKSKLFKELLTKLRDRFLGKLKGPINPQMSIPGIGPQPKEVEGTPLQYSLRQYGIGTNPQISLSVLDEKQAKYNFVLVSEMALERGKPRRSDSIEIFKKYSK